MTDRLSIPDAAMRGHYILAGAIIAGSLIFLGVVLVLVHVTGFAASGTSPIVSIVAIAFTAAEVVPFLLVDRIVASATARQAQIAPSQSAEPGTVADYLGKHRGRMILRFALCQGACFLNIVAYLQEQNWWTLVVIGGLLLVMAAMFPTRTRVEHWVETQQMLRQETN